ncbi:hypothetical protein EH31_16955 [Erythrobacter longus]|uniref:CHAT domain-containing protein n=1 Tax=Erythrobacter longus TaxID=1044 RepID=A0A074M7H2_ERYLO|nr:CHAT domain-containing tetratricopeptide repeat protein [Erythrobacter longus]KEO88645.1 hypothetical protein EH31_16955 [Erythrobacter longus]
MLASLGAFALWFAPPANAQEAQNTYSTSLQQYAHLQTLEDRAIDLQENGAQDEAGRIQSIAAWQALQDAAAQTLLADGSPHPLFHMTKLKIASQLYRNGAIDEALELAQSGIEGGRPYLESYPAAMADGAALIGLLLTQKGEPERGFSMTQETYAEFTKLGDGARGPGFTMAKSNLEFSLSQTALRMGRTQEALDYQKASLDTREGRLGPNNPDTIAAYYSYAQTLRRADRMEEAEAYARTAVERASAHVDPSHPSYARSFEMLGIILANSGRPIEATDFLTTALELKREYEGADTLIFGYGIHNLGSILLQREKYEEVQPLFAEAEAIMTRYQGPNSAFPILALAYNGQASLALGNPGEAITLLDDGLQRLGEDTQDVEALGRIVPDLVRSLMLTGQNAEALRHAQTFESRVLASDKTDGLEIALASLLLSYAQPGDLGDGYTDQAYSLLGTIQRSLGDEQSSALTVRHLAAVDLAMEIAAQHSDAELMLSAMSLISRSQLARASSRRAEQLRAGDPGLAALLRERAEASDRMKQADRAMLLAMARGEVTEGLRDELERMRVAIAAIEENLQRGFPQWAEASLPPETSISALQDALAEDEAVLAVTPVYYGTYALLITPSEAKPIALQANRKTIVDLSNALGSSVRVGSFDETTSRRLGQMLFTSEIMEQLAHTQALRIYTNGPLASLPFSLLKAGGTGGDEAWLVDRFSLSYLADLSAWEEEPAERGDRSDALDLVAFAAPAPFESTTRGDIPAASAPSRMADYFSRSSIDTEALASLPPLPGTAEEVRTIAAAIPWRSQRLFIGAEANEASIRMAETSRADIIVVATHGIVAGEIEGIAEPALVLSPGVEIGNDGLLTASEIAILEMHAEWVILSSCDSAAGMEGGLPAFSGLTQAFRKAGAKDLLVSHWKVRDDIAAFVSSRTVINHLSGMSKADALRGAIRELRSDSGIEGANSPFAWAPFVLIEG